MPKKEFVGNTLTTAEELFCIKREQKFAVNAKYLKDALNAVSAVTLDNLKTAIIRTATDNPKATILIQTNDEKFDFQQIILPIRFTEWDN